MVTICESAKDVKACLDAFAEQAKSIPWQIVAFSLGSIAAIAFSIQQIFSLKKAHREMIQIHNKRESLALIIALVIFSTLLALPFFLTFQQTAPLYLFLGPVGFLPHIIARRVYPEKN